MTRGDGEFLSVPANIEEEARWYVAELWRQHYETLYLIKQPMPERTQAWRGLLAVLQPKDGIEADVFRSGCDIYDGSCMLFDRIFAGSIRRNLHVHTDLPDISSAPKRDRGIRWMRQECGLSQVTEILVNDLAVRGLSRFRPPEALPRELDRPDFTKKYFSLDEDLVRVDDWFQRLMPYGETYMYQTFTLTIIADLLKTSETPEERKVFRF